MKLTRKDFLDVVVGGAAGSVVTTIAGAGDAVAAQSGAVQAPKKLEGAAIKGATEAIRNFILRTDFRSLPPGVVALGKQCLVDGFGVILAGSTVPGSQIVRKCSSRRSATGATPRSSAATRFARRRRSPRWPTAPVATRWTTTIRSCRRRPIARSGC